MIDLSFVLAGKATFTVSNPTGEHYTYKVRRKKATPSGELYFISMLTGPDNTYDYTYMGILDRGNHAHITKASRYLDSSKPVRVFNWAMDVITGKRKLPDGYAIRHAGRCGRCGRLLTTPESITSGYGPECIKLIAGGN